MSDWLIPTARATTWQPLAAVAGGLTLTSAGRGRRRDMAGGTSPYRVRRGRRGGGRRTARRGFRPVVRDADLGGDAARPTARPAAARRRSSIWLIYTVVGRQLEPGLGWYLGPVTALTGTGLAVAAWTPTENPVAAGVAVPLAWVAASQLLMGLDTAAADVLLVWQQHPWLVTVAAGTALLVRRER